MPSGGSVSSRSQASGPVAPSVDKFSNILAIGGVGVRFLESREYGVNIGVDGAITKEGEKAYYIQVSEAF
jgi:hypothetical protein